MVVHCDPSLHYLPWLHLRYFGKCASKADHVCIQQSHFALSHPPSTGQQVTKDQEISTQAPKVDFAELAPTSGPYMSLNNNYSTTHPDSKGQSTQGKTGPCRNPANSKQQIHNQSNSTSGSQTSRQFRAGIILRSPAPTSVL